MNTSDAEEASPQQRVEPTQRRRVGCLTYGLLGLLLLGGGGALVVWQWDRATSRDLADAVAEVRSRGEPLTFAELAPQPIGPQRDGGVFYAQALAAFVEPASDFQSAYGGDVTLPLPSAVPSPDPVVQRALKANAASLELLRRAMQRPMCQLPREYHSTEPFAMRLDDLGKLRSLGRLLSAELVHALTAGDHTRAVQIVHEQFGISELLRDEPLLVGQLVRIALGRMALKSLAHCLAYGAASDAELDAFEQRLRTLVDGFSLQRAVVGERAAIYTSLLHWDRGAWPEASLEHGWLYRVAPLRKSDQALCLRYLTRAVDLVDRPGVEADDAMRRLEDDIAQLSWFHAFVKLMYPAISGVRDEGLRYRQALHNARWGVAAVRHRQHGAWPAALGEIAAPPESLPREGICSGKPLVYRLLPEGGIVIYDVGRNQVDEQLDTQDRDETATAFRVVPPAARQ